LQIISGLEGKHTRQRAQSGKHFGRLVGITGCTPLHWAAIRGNLDACTVLVQAGSLEDLMAKDKTGLTATQLASDKGHRHVAFFLVSQACTPFFSHKSSVSWSNFSLTSPFLFLGGGGSLYSSLEAEEMLLCSSNHMGCDVGPFLDSQMHDGYSKISGKARADYSNFANWAWHLCFFSLFLAC
jgi:hypothetical protein